MKKLHIVLVPSSLIIAGLATALYYHVDTEMGQAIAFAIAFMASLHFVVEFLKGIFFPPRDFKIVDSRMEELPEDIRNDMQAVEIRIREYFKSQKCDDPHCKNCHPELND